MAEPEAISSPQEKRRYTCSTQKELSSELLPAKKQVQEGEEQPPVGNGDDSIIVGLGTQVPRWDTAKENPRQLKYFIQVRKFPSQTKAHQAGEAFQKAADEWNAIEMGVNISATEDASKANFDLSYWDPDDSQDTTLAMAFFPNEKNQTVWVYKSAFDPRNMENLTPIFKHEIGHTLGLRHEFAITGDADKGLDAEGEGARQFMEPNYDSVMSYNFPPTIQDTDKSGIKAFYKLKNGSKIGGQPVVDYFPTIKKRQVQINEGDS
jgi:hypothetical protein